MLRETWADEELPDEFWAALPSTTSQAVITRDFEQLKSELQDFEVSETLLIAGHGDQAQSTDVHSDRVQFRPCGGRKLAAE